MRPIPDAPSHQPAQPADSAHQSDHLNHGLERPRGVLVLVRPNHYEAGRAHLAVFNWDRQASVELDLAATGLELQNYFGKPVVLGRFDGSTVKLPMTGLAVADPIDGAPSKPPHTGPEFGVFVVRKAL